MKRLTRTPRPVPRMAQVLNADLTLTEIRELARQERLAVKASCRRYRQALIDSGDLVPDSPVPQPSLVGRTREVEYVGSHHTYRVRLPYRVLGLDDAGRMSALDAVHDFRENGGVPDRDTEWYTSVNRWAGFELCERVFE